MLIDNFILYFYLKKYKITFQFKMKIIHNI